MGRSVQKFYLQEAGDDGLVGEFMREGSRHVFDDDFLAMREFKESILLEYFIDRQRDFAFDERKVI